MEFRVLATAAALHDAVAIGEWIASKGASAEAGRWVEGLIDAAGLLAQATMIYASDSSFTGGNGQSDGNQGGAGGNGAYSDTSIIASRCMFQGGNGGDATEPFCDWDPGEGGDGLYAFGMAKVLECSLQGGSGGIGAGAGSPGQPYTGPVDFVNGQGRSLFAPSLVQSPALLSVELQGLPGELVYLLVSSALDPLPTAAGVLLAPAPALVPLGALPPGGSLPLALPLPGLPPGLEHIVLHAQGLFVDPGGATWPRVSGFSTLIWL